ncbi:MAG: hypothetical protein JO340_17800 [Acidobacteriaceae bacterium]|nr:hypothetical protein [Acidobacteriaceae bacterium]
MAFSADGREITGRYLYSDVDFDDLRSRFGSEFLDRLAFHIMALEAIPLAASAPSDLDLGPFARFHAASFEQLWRTVFLKAGAEWRYRNSLPSYYGPRFSSQPCVRSHSPVLAAPGPIETLCFCGGGKDSLAAMQLFETAGLPFSTHSYSHPSYGPARAQFELIDNLLDCSSPLRRHRIQIESDSPRPHPSLCAETPLSIFGALPIALQHGYRSLALGNERSADEANLLWPATGECVNHQWGKSLEAELLLASYIRDHLVSNVHCFSVLRPLHDTVIFHFLRRSPKAVLRTHSCNNRKPWCYSCAKCAYVGLGFLAYLPADVACKLVPADLFDRPAVQDCFRELLGLGSHKPFECVGGTDETRLAFELCHAEGLHGRAIDLYLSRARCSDPLELAQCYTRIAGPPSSFPPSAWAALSPVISAAGCDAYRFISTSCRFERSLATAP